jgi:hypothetical protein
LNIVPATQITRAKGIPSEKYEVGTHHQGLRTDGEEEALKGKGRGRRRPGPEASQVITLVRQ